jgi:uncharacterized protein
MAEQPPQHGIDKMQNSGDSDMDPLNRQYTVSLTPDQYERLFFQPTAPKGDLAKTLGNPTWVALRGWFHGVEPQGQWTNILLFVRFVIRDYEAEQVVRLLGLLGFLVPFSSTMFCLLNFQGASANSLASLTGIWYFYGGIEVFLDTRCLQHWRSCYRHGYGDCWAVRVHTWQHISIRCVFTL